MDRFAKLEVNLPHAGGTLPWLIGRWERGREVRPELKHMTKPVDSYLKRFTHDKLVGAERVTLGSDHCFDMGLDDPLAAVNRIRGITEQEKQAIAGGNALRLLKL